eukprot:Nitzschia sp. Nitz4//scaffold313_size41840//17949//18275//NITZ4_007434-RA/size41840-processed-gene-0.9-mRNA-1//-1//CDS//3329547424//793//frame0
MDCLVLLPYGSNRKSYSFLTTFCQVVQEEPTTNNNNESTSIRELGQRVIQNYGLEYESYMILESETVLENGLDTAILRQAANQLAVVDNEWKEHSPGVWLRKGPANRR